MSLSKLFNERITKENLLCVDIFHPGESCSEFNWFIFTRTWMHCARFYAPMVLLPLVKKLNKFEWKEVKEALTIYIHMILGSYIPSVFTITLICLCCKLFGRIYLPTMVYVPNFIVTMIYMPFMDERVASIYSNIMLMVNSEAIIREGRTPFWRILRDSKLIQTILFMMFSAIILDTMRTMQTTVFWFINPYIDKGEENSIDHPHFVESPIFDAILPTEKHICEHKNSCDQFIWQGTKKTTIMILGFELARSMLTNLNALSLNPLQLIIFLRKEMNFPLISMLIGYTSIYRISRCLQNRLARKLTDHSNLISGFLSGSVFWLNADWSILCHGFAVATQLIFQNHLKRWLKSKNNTVTDYATVVPWNKIFYTLTIGYAFHLRVLYPTLCSNLMHKISDMVSSKRLREMSRHTLQFLL